MLTLPRFRRILVKFILLLATGLLVTLPYAAAAQEQNGISLTARAGFDGFCKDGSWVPVRVSMENQGQSFEGRLEARVLSSFANETTYAQAVSLPNTSRKETFLYVFPESYLSELEIDLVSNGTTIASTSVKLTCLGGGDLLMGVMADSPSTFNILSEIEPPDGRTTIAQLNPGDLPEQAPALQALDVLVISGVDTGTLTPAQRQALSTWLAGGGQLIVTGGLNWQKSSAGVSDLLPMQPESTQSLSSIGALSDFSGAAESPSGEAIVTRGKLASGSQVLVSQDEVPLAVRRQLGYGQVTFLAVDPSLEPLRSWDGLSDLYHQLVFEEITRPSWAGGFQNWPAATSAVASLPNLGMPGAGLIIGFLLLYVIAIGPVNYLLLRILKRRELAWISIPALVIAFSVAAFLFGGLARGSRPVFNQLAIVQVWPDSGQAKVDGLLGVFSPRRATYQLQVGPGFLVQPFPDNDRISNRGRMLVLANGDAGTNVPDLRIDVSDISPVALEGTIPAPAFSYDLELDIGPQGATLQGSITNDSNLTLSNAVLLVPGSSQSLGEIKPNERVEIKMPLKSAERAAPSNAGAVTSSGAPLIYYPGRFFSDSTFTDILGTSDFYSDQQNYRRFNLLNATSNSGPYGGSGRGAGFYLAGWSESSPIEASLEGQTTSQTNTTLYLVAFNPRITSQGDHLTLPPGLFTWSPLTGGNRVPAAPYAFDLDPGLYSFRFKLAQPTAYRAIEALRLHMESYGSRGPLGLNVSLWDFDQEQWVPQSGLEWGDNDILQPERYVGKGGEIRIELENNSSNFAPVPLEKADFTLEVTP